jgi:hypothetical protein
MRRSVWIGSLALLCLVFFTSAQRAFADPQGYDRVEDILIPKAAAYQSKQLSLPRSFAKSLTVRVYLIQSTSHSPSATRDEMDYVLRRSPTNVEKRYHELSRGQIRLQMDSDGDGKTDIVGPYTYEGAEGQCPYQQAGLEAKQKFLDEFPNAPEVDLELFVLPRFGNCDFSGIAYLNGRNSYYQGASEVTIMHELGHNFGLGHAAAELEHQDGSLWEYGDEGCFMGRAGASLNVAHLHQLGLMNEGEIIEITTPLPAGYSKTFTLSNLAMRLNQKGTYGILINDTVNNEKIMLSAQSFFQGFDGEALLSSKDLVDKSWNSLVLRMHEIRYAGKFADTVYTRNMRSYVNYISNNRSFEISNVHQDSSEITITIRALDHVDYDRDGIGDVDDTDDDNDGIPDEEDCELNILPQNNELLYDGDNDGFPSPDTESFSRRKQYNNCSDINSDSFLYDSYRWFDSSVPRDNCPMTFNPEQTLGTTPHLGIVCDPTLDTDGDGVTNDLDCAPYDALRWKISLTSQLYEDKDLDGIPEFGGWIKYLYSICSGATLQPAVLQFQNPPEHYDNCPTVSNPSQYDMDNDKHGDACDDDADGDLIRNDIDCESFRYSSRSNDQRVFLDKDSDGFVDAEDAYILACNDALSPNQYLLKKDRIDNCALVSNATQSDRNGNGTGDACDTVSISEDAYWVLRRLGVNLSKVARIKKKALLATNALQIRSYLDKLEEVLNLMRIVNDSRATSIVVSADKFLKKTDEFIGAKPSKSLNKKSYSKLIRAHKQLLNKVTKIALTD